MIRALVGSYTVNVALLQDEVVSTVLEREPAASRGNTGAEAVVVGIDKRARVAFAIDHAEVYRVGGGAQEQTRVTRAGTRGGLVR